mgnify:CR=1 FL=1
MDQKIEGFTAADTADIEKQRSWVRDHCEAEARDNYETLQGKYELLETILSSGWVGPQETWKLQSLGVTFGDMLVQLLELEWVMVEDDQGRDPALRVPGTSILVFPKTAISKRIERGERVDVKDLLRTFAQHVENLRDDPKVT